jgi:hypothetical protein
MSIFCSEQGRTRVYAEAYCLYVVGENPRRTLLRGKRAIYGWKLGWLLHPAGAQAPRTDLDPLDSSLVDGANLL